MAKLRCDFCRKTGHEVADCRLVAAMGVAVKAALVSRPPRRRGRRAGKAVKEKAKAKTDALPVRAKEEQAPEHNSPVTPRLLGFRDGYEGEDEFVPGGYKIAMVFERVSGTRLADDHSGFYSEDPPKLLREFSKREDRDLIRAKFNEAHAELVTLGWMPQRVWADHIVWDRHSTKIWFVDLRGAEKHEIRQPETRREKDKQPAADLMLMYVQWVRWGLGDPPGKKKDWHNLELWTL